MDPIDHVLNRADMYVGSMRTKNSDEFIASDYSQILKKTINYSPAILRIFIEILSNSIDNVARGLQSGRACTIIKVNIDKNTGMTSIWNDGDYIDIEINEKEKCYNHSLIFGQLLTSSNYDDKRDRYDISGRNGVGGKVTSIFSSYFRVKGCDPENKKNFEQVWKNNMKIVEKPVISKTTGKQKGYTEVTWIPDFARFGITGYSQDIIDMYRKYAIDTAMLTGKNKVSVYFNDVLVPIKSLIEYTRLYECKEEDEESECEVLEINHKDYQVVLMPSFQFQAISFCNGVCTSLGGIHVDAWIETLLRPVVEKVSKPNGTVFTMADVKKYFKIFVVVTVINPEFESQNKLRLESPKPATAVTKKDINKLLKWSIIEDIIKSKELTDLKKLERKKKTFIKIDGLDPANHAGGKLSTECTLILVEGLSAKSFAVQGISTGVFGKVGRDFNGIMPLRGKILNVRNAKTSVIGGNKVVSDIIKALGLKVNIDYTNDENYKTLQYGKILMLCDQDCFVESTPLVIRRKGESSYTLTGSSVTEVLSIKDLSKNMGMTDSRLGALHVTGILDTDVWSMDGWTAIRSITRKKTSRKILKISTNVGMITCTECHRLMLENGQEIEAKDVEIGDHLLRTQGHYKGPDLDYSQYYMRNTKGDVIIHGQTEAHKVCFLIECTGSEYVIKEEPGDVFIISVCEYQPDCAVHTIEYVDYPIDKYVYDIETENHLLNAGVGRLVVHNCDGFHIVGLLQNFFHSLFPTLLERKDSFLTSMQTPIVRVFLGKKQLLFYDEREYHKYVETYNKQNPGKTVDKKYYKGLGTSTDSDIEETFGKKMILFKNDDQCLTNMNKIFHKKFTDSRKKWLTDYDSTDIKLAWKKEGEEMLDLDISDFLNSEMIKFSINDCQRSIPHVLDGLKESHRKVLYACILRGLKYSGKTLKVAQLAGYTAEKTGYHHGEQNLFDTITKMAQAFPGSNNIPLLNRDGQFGSRCSGGEDAASARYIFTKMDYLTRYLFRPEDDVLLERNVDDGDIIEPKYYVPILPTILINGGEGIGTGWSSSVPSFNPLDLVSSVKEWLDKDGCIYEETKEFSISSLPDITPWYRDFTGKIEKVNESKYISWGHVSTEKNTKVVDELPIGMWTDNFKAALDELLESKEIKSVKNYSTTHDVRFVISETSDGISCNENNLKLYKHLSTNNMVLFTDKGTLKKFNNTDEIIDAFCKVRYEYYGKRKKYMLEMMSKEIKFLDNKKRFLQEVIQGDIKLFDESGKGVKRSRKTSDLITELAKRGYANEVSREVRREEVEGEEEEKEETNGFNYLLRLQFRSITDEKVKSLTDELSSKVKAKTALGKKSAKELWVNDLDEFVVEYNKWLVIVKKERKEKKKGK